MTSRYFDLTFSTPKPYDPARVAALGQDGLTQLHITAVRAALGHLAKMAAVVDQPAAPTK